MPQVTKLCVALAQQELLDIVGELHVLPRAILQLAFHQHIDKTAHRTQLHVREFHGCGRKRLLDQLAITQLNGVAFGKVHT